MKVKVGETYNSKGACLNCGEANDRATQIVKEQDEANRPKDGDLSICAYCGHVAIFTADGSLREPTKEEDTQIERDPIVAKLRTIKNTH